MKPPMLIGVILIVVGILILVLRGILFTNTNPADSGPIKLEEKQEDAVPVLQIIGAVSLAGGIFLTVLGSRK